MNRCAAYMYVCAPHACLVPKKPEEAVKFPVAGVADTCELPCRCRELNPGSLEEQSAFLTHKPSLWLLNFF